VWPSFGAFLTDIWKKLLVSILAVPILAIGTLVYSKAILVGVSSFSSDWYANYYYIVILSFTLSLGQAYILYKRRSLFGWSLGMTCVLTAIYCLYRLEALSILGHVQLVVYFFLFCVILFQLLVTLLFIVWRMLANILA
jgi:hypothetical protein